MKFGSLFAGIGGFDLGLERAGMECAWQVEIDPYCQKVLAKHWPEVERFSDVRECGSKNLSTVDLICGGFPCQPFSVAGKQRGAADNRYLWPEMLRIIAELHPGWVIGENVPGIVSMALDDVLASLEGEGYTCETFVIPACAVNAPHRRDRVWIVAHTEYVRQSGQPHTGQGRNIRESTRIETEQCGETVADPSGDGCHPDNWWGFVQNGNRNGAGAVREGEQQQRAWGNGNVPDSDGPQRGTISKGRDVSNGDDTRRQETPDGLGVFCEDVTYTAGNGRQPWGPGNSEKSSERWELDRGGKRGYVCNPIGSGLAKWEGQRGNSRPQQQATVGADREIGEWWAVEPELGRVAHGIPHRVDRLRALGNAVVPQVVELIGRAIVDADACKR